MLIDTHAHIDMENFKNSFDDVIKTAEEYGVKKIVIPGVEPSGFDRIVELCEKYENTITPIIVQISISYKPLLTIIIRNNAT